MAFSRSLLFYFLYLITGMIAGMVSLFLWPLPFTVRYRVVMKWNILVIWLAKVLCGIDFCIIGQENIPAPPYVVLSKHQSTWETLMLQNHFQPISTILKKELLQIPFFGWGLALLKPIAIDRNNPRDAMRYIQKEGQKRLNEGISVLVFPEGTRTPVGKVGNYARGGAGIACAAGVPVIPVAHNAGECWPVPGFIKHPGKITLVIGKPISTTGQTSREVTEQAKTWIEEQIRQMPPARRSK
ncbi:MAG: 1-acyl-sn-glycerol-3-phosphate acyltransferase [Pseudomonadales bacterium]|nr:1-acyl-sn-glycerol-3-phosphate acyltransferase [Pseudomonadales bacterium]